MRPQSWAGEKHGERVGGSALVGDQTAPGGNTKEGGVGLCVQDEGAMHDGWQWSVHTAGCGNVAAGAAALWFLWRYDCTSPTTDRPPHQVSAISEIWLHLHTLRC